MLLGDQVLQKKTFAGLDAVFKRFKTREYKQLIDRERSEKINRALLELIQKEPEPCFLLAAVLDFIERVEREKLLQHYTFTSFELWLNHHSGLSDVENFSIRGKIVGKRIDRSDYQALFPIGMGKIYPGTHFVTAHKSPDLDTTIASFWGWVDSFGARVGEAVHVWNLPGGPPQAQIEIDWIFRNLFGNAVFTHLAKNRTSLNLTGNDLMVQKGMIRKGLVDSINSIDHNRDHPAVVIVDDRGFYIGDWRNFDVEGVHQVILLFSSCLRWFENNLHLQLISLFAKPNLRFAEIKPWLQRLFGMELLTCEPVVDFTQKQKREVADFAVSVLGLKKGLNATFEEVGFHLNKLWGITWRGVDALAASMKSLFDKKNQLQEDRPHIFSFLETEVRALHESLLKIRLRLEKLDVALQTKQTVFGHMPTFVTVRSDVEEIRQKMGTYLSLTVVYPDDGKMFPVGVIQAQDLRKSVLGTVSLRDFCNREEMGIPSYLSVISVIDHHKSELQTSSPPFAIIADAQSSNTLVAQQAFEINDRYSLGGQTEGAIDRQIKACEKGKIHLLQRLLKKKMAADRKGPFFIHPEREYIEYLHFLYGILDDTDLLTKVSQLDVEVVASLLNRLKSQAMKKEVEIISLEDLPRDKNFEKQAAKRILQNEDMYSLYKKVYLYREKEVSEKISQAARKEPSGIFADTKEQNGCCRIGQLKMFASNVSVFTKHVDALRRSWLAAEEQVYRERAEIDLHLYMISTIVSAEEVYRGVQQKYEHQDELWIWIPPIEAAVEHLKRFLTSFQSSPALKGKALSVEFLGDNSKELSAIFKESFLDIPQQTKNKNLPIAVLRYPAGSINSRKAMISPYLPTLNYSA